MSHTRGLFFTCQGTWRKHGKAYHGTQQWRCSKCGQLKNTKIRCVPGLHHWGRTRSDPTLRCAKCGKVK